MESNVMTFPSTIGRRNDGTFAAGNPGGPGNPHVQKVAKLRSAMLQCVTEKSMRNVIRKLIDMAEGGDLKAIELLLNRTVGKPQDGPNIAIQNICNAAPELNAKTIADRVRAMRDAGEGE